MLTVKKYIQFEKPHCDSGMFFNVVGHNSCRGAKLIINQ